MTAVLPATAKRAAPRLRPRALRLHQVALPWRLVRRSSALIWLSAAAYMAMEVAVFKQAYPTVESRAKLRELSSSTAVRMMQGDPGASDTPGGYAVWDGGWMLMIIVGAWALLTVTRLTRGEEDTGRAELVLSRPLTARTQLGGTLAALSLSALGLAVTAALPFVVLGEPVEGAFVWGAGLAAFGLVMGALGALVAQVVEPRRRAVSVGLALLAAAYLLRVVANSADERSWLLSATPFGWVDRLSPFGTDQWAWLAVPLLAGAVLGGTALVLCGRRDTGAALLRDPAHHRGIYRLLGSAPSFLWRLTTGALVAWVAVMAVVSAVFGLMTQALLDFIEEDASYRELLESMGLDMSVPLAGFLSYLGLTIALTVVAFVGFRVGSLRQEEAEGRLDNLLVRGVVRWRLLATTSAHAFLAAALLVAVSGLGMWAGAKAVGAPVGMGDVAEPMVGTLPVVALFVGLAVLLFGLAPRLTTVATVTLGVTGFLLDTFGTTLGWPEWLLAVSPYHHLARLPSDPMTLPAVLTLSGLGVALTAAGVAAFSRRDLRGL